MYAKSFLALDGNGRLTGARTAQAAPYAHYTCHLCGSALRYHPQQGVVLYFIVPVQVCVSRRVCTGLTKFNRDKIVVSVQPEPSGQNLTN